MKIASLLISIHWFHHSDDWLRLDLNRPFTQNSMRGDDFMVAFWSFLNLAALLYLIYLLVKIVKKIK
jgi:hypothetical protein